MTPGSKPTNKPKLSMERSGRLQFWLQAKDWGPSWWIGNRIADVRFWVWKLRSGGEE